jgi:DNA-binding response OmpR family regulator
MKQNKKETKTILIVDDEADFCMLMTTFFEKKGFTISMAGTIHEGLRLLDELQPDYLFLDNNLPDGFGWSNTQFVLEKYPNTRLVLISALQTPQTSASSFSILYKPYILEGLERMFPSSAH